MERSIAQIVIPLLKRAVKPIKHKQESPEDPEMLTLVIQSCITVLALNTHNIEDKNPNTCEIWSNFNEWLTRFIDDNKVQTKASLNSPPVISTLFARELKSQTKNKRAQSYVAHLRKRSRVKSKPLYYYNQILVEDL